MFIVLITGKGNGNPLQYSYLENPVDRGAWWAAVHGVARSPTRVKQLSMHACVGEGNGNPLQCSCLENPVDRGAWWAAVHGVAQSRTCLKRLSTQARIGEGNGNPLQYFCLENPRDRGAWWAAVCGVTQSCTRLKRLSSSSSRLSLQRKEKAEFFSVTSSYPAIVSAIKLFDQIVKRSKRHAR